jgi:hypothetical protein
MLEHLAQIYLVSSVTGSGFILINFAMGQMGAAVHAGGGHTSLGGHVGGGAHMGSGGHVAVGGHLGSGGYIGGGAHIAAGGHMVSSSHIAIGGHLGTGGHIGGGMHDAGSGGHDFGASGDGSGSGGHDFGASGDGSGSGGHDFGASGDGGSADGSPTSSASTHANAAQAALGSYRLAGAGGKSSGRVATTLTPHAGQHLELSDRLGFFIMGILSPMNIAIQLAFFGFGGLAVLRAYPPLGIFTLIPAIVIALCASHLFKLIVGWMVRSMDSAPPVSMNDIVGQVGEVNTPITAGHLGEITYVADAKRCHAPAKAQSSTLSLKRGDKVIITDSDQGVVVVTPWSDTQLEEEFTPQ